MALAVIRPQTTQQRVHALLMQLHSGVGQERLIDEARECVQRYERVYHVQSECIHQAIDAGDLVETQDVSEWILLYNLLKRVDRA
jgi:hypothetical protein